MQNTKLLEQIQEMLKENEIPLTFEQARQLLQVSKSTLYKLTFRRAIPFTKPGGGKLYFKKADLLAWMNKNPVKTADQIDEAAANHIMYK
jgi:excisionase family DNA binding protein